MTMSGMNVNTGKSLSGLDHLRQSISDILSTPIGSRVMRKDYGSRLFSLIDAPGNGDNLVQLYAAIAEALSKWEPRFKLSRVWASGINDAGQATVSLEGEYLISGKSVTLENIEL